MNPGYNPIFIYPGSVVSNVPPPGNIPYVKPPVVVLFAHPDEDPVPIALRNQGNP